MPVAYFTSLSSIDTTFDDLRPRRPNKVSPRSSPLTSDSNSQSLGQPTTPVSVSPDSHETFPIILTPTTSMTKLRTRSPSSSTSASVSTCSLNSNKRNYSPSSPKSLEKTIRDIGRNYMISFEKFEALHTNNGEEQESFRQFLQSECNLAPLEFYEKVTEFKNQSSNEMKVNLAIELITNYIREGSINEINITNSIREQIEKEFKESKENHCEISQYLFDKAYTEVKLSLKNDSFARFVTSDNFNKLILSKFTQITNNSKTPLSESNTWEVLSTIFESIGSLSPLSSPKFNSSAVNQSLDIIVTSSSITVTPPNEA